MEFADLVPIKNADFIRGEKRFIVQEMESHPSVIEEAIALTRALGKAELEFVASLTAPLFWILRDSTGKEMVKTGSVFFLNAGHGAFAVTAAHVVTECRDDTRSPMFVQCMIGRGGGKESYPINIGDRVIDYHAAMDIATLRFSPAEVEKIGRTVLAGDQKTWPPRLVGIDGGVTLCGFRGKGRRWLAPREISFGIVGVAGLATNAHETCISVQIERERYVRVLGQEDMPEDFDFGGLSGGPVLAIVQTGTLLSWQPAGIIFQGPNPDPAESIQGLEIIRARPVHFINPDGTLDIDRWNQSNPTYAPKLEH